MRSLLATVLLAGTALVSATSYAQFAADACIVARGGNSCTANEGGAITATPVACASLTPAEIAANTNGCLTPATPSCISGSTVPVKLLVGLAQNNADRYDVGVYISTDGNKPLNLSPANGGAATCGVSAMLIPPGTALDPNTCGDQPAQTALADNIPLSSAIACTSGTGGLLAVQLGASYQQNKGTTTSCSFPGTTQVAPGTGSKCNTNSLTVPIQVIIPAASVQLVKHLVPGTDPGLFNLSIASNPPAGPASTVANVTEGGSVTRNDITPGTVVTLSETAGTGTDLNNYTSSLACVRTDNQQSVPVTPEGTITMPTPEVGIVCTFTNTRKGRSVQVIKDVLPNGDTGLFNLLVNDTAVRTNAGDGDGGTRTGVAVGSVVTVNETAGAGTNLGNYTTSLLCTGATPTGTLPGSFTMPDTDVTCTYTNTRKAYAVTLIKALSPSDDPGLFDLQINSQTVASGVGNGGSGSNPSVTGGTAVTVRELAVSGTLLGNYSVQLSCPGVQVSGTNPGGFTMPDNDLTCTYTNTRIPPPPEEVPIPTLSEWLILLLGLMVVGTGWLFVRRR